MKRGGLRRISPELPKLLRPQSDRNSERVVVGKQLPPRSMKRTPAALQPCRSPNCPLRKSFGGNCATYLILARQATAGVLIVVLSWLAGVSWIEAVFRAHLRDERKILAASDQTNDG